MAAQVESIKWVPGEVLPDRHALGRATADGPVELLVPNVWHDTACTGAGMAECWLQSFGCVFVMCASHKGAQRRWHMKGVSLPHLPLCAGTKFMVDGFAFLNPKCQHYFLTHCHSDHTCGLRRRFDAGTIWCSPVRCATRPLVLAPNLGAPAPCRRVHAVQQSWAAPSTPAPHQSCCLPLSAAVAHSAKLLAAEWNLRAPTVRVLQANQPTVIEGVTVTALDANHCPGAVMLLFEVRTAQGTVKRILHTGDCR